MMAMMEKYANNLEALVDERTDQLSEEKKKTGKLQISTHKKKRKILSDILIYCLEIHMLNNFSS